MGFRNAKHSRSFTLRFWHSAEGLVCGDSRAGQYTAQQRDAITPALWPLVQTDPRSGRKILYVGIHACEIVGMNTAEARMLIMDLIEHATQPAFVYEHHWQVGDLVMWDNTATIHRGRWYDLGERREMRRATTEEVVLSPEAAAA